MSLLLFILGIIFHNTSFLRGNIQLQYEDLNKFTQENDIDWEEENNDFMDWDKDDGERYEYTPLQ